MTKLTGEFATRREAEMAGRLAVMGGGVCARGLRVGEWPLTRSWRFCSGVTELAEKRSRQG